MPGLLNWFIAIGLNLPPPCRCLPALWGRAGCVAAGPVVLYDITRDHCGVDVSLGPQDHGGILWVHGRRSGSRKCSWCTWLILRNFEKNLIRRNLCLKVKTEDAHKFKVKTEDAHRFKDETEDAHGFKVETEDAHGFKDETEDANKFTPGQKQQHHLHLRRAYLHHPQLRPSHKASCRTGSVPSEPSALGRCFVL
ncbi:hypothetical protein PGQ11_001972 [Apiospora arundinis]|uniref:Uncharacterized protein n=1 Tax=Apiospora arundinis TaxID=335852 RepID=A0ABR2JH21_9PEZI